MVGKNATTVTKGFAKGAAVGLNVALQLYEIYDLFKEMDTEHPAATAIEEIISQLEGKLDGAKELREAVNAVQRAHQRATRTRATPAQNGRTAQSQSTNNADKNKPDKNAAECDKGDGAEDEDPKRRPNRRTCENPLSEAEANELIRLLWELVTEIKALSEDQRKSKDGLRTLLDRRKKRLPTPIKISVSTCEARARLETGSLSKLANFCLSSNIEVSGIEGFDGASVLLRKDDDVPKIAVSFRNALGCEKWLYVEKTDSCAIHERSYTGVGAKSAKFTFTEHGLRSVAKKLPRIRPSQLCELVHDPSGVHVDLFTLSPHPSSPVQHLRVNWHFGNGYNSSAKLFERNAFFPLKSMVYEDLPILAPANLEEYLTVEYGYLGRDAMYDRETQREFIRKAEAVLEKGKQASDELAIHLEKLSAEFEDCKQRGMSEDDAALIAIGKLCLRAPAMGTLATATMKAYIKDINSQMLDLGLKTESLTAKNFLKQNAATASKMVGKNATSVTKSLVKGGAIGLNVALQLYEIYDLFNELDTEHPAATAIEEIISQLEGKLDGAKELRKAVNAVQRAHQRATRTRATTAQNGRTAQSQSTKDDDKNKPGKNAAECDMGDGAEDEDRKRRPNRRTCENHLSEAEANQLIRLLRELVREIQALSEDQRKSKERLQTLLDRFTEILRKMCKAGFVSSIDPKTRNLRLSTTINGRVLSYEISREGFYLCGLDPSDMENVFSTVLFGGSSEHIFCNEVGAVYHICAVEEENQHIRYVGLVGHFRTLSAIKPTTPTSSPTLAPATNPALTATPVPIDHTVAAPPRRPAPPPCPNPCIDCSDQHHRHV
nr:unnamed protein product [Spirometra erinaceieuropaei]